MLTISNIIKYMCIKQKTSINTQNLIAQIYASSAIATQTHTQIHKFAILTAQWFSELRWLFPNVYFVIQTVDYTQLDSDVYMNMKVNDERWAFYKEDSQKCWVWLVVVQTEKDVCVFF